VRDATVPRFNSPAEPARTVGFGNQAASARERDLTVREREKERKIGCGIGIQPPVKLDGQWLRKVAKYGLCILIHRQTTRPGLAKTGEGLTGYDDGQQGRAGHGRVSAGPVRAGHGRGADWL